MSLTTEVKASIVKGLMSYWSRHWEVTGVSVQDLEGAVDVADTWIEDNQGSYNSALPANAQSGLTTAQKTIVFCAVALARVSIPFLKKVFGG